MSAGQGAPSDAVGLPWPKDVPLVDGGLLFMEGNMTSDTHLFTVGVLRPNKSLLWAKDYLTFKAAKAHFDRCAAAPEAAPQSLPKEQGAPSDVMVREKRDLARWVADELAKQLADRNIDRAREVLFLHRLIIHEALEAFTHPNTATRQTIAAAYEAGATDSHNDWLHGQGERGARISEAALDYADAVLRVPATGGAS